MVGRPENYAREVKKGNLIYPGHLFTSGPVEIADSLYRTKSEKFACITMSLNNHRYSKACHENYLAHYVNHYKTIKSL